MDISILEYIKPELLILVPVMYLIGVGLKNTTVVKDKLIPLVLGLISVLLSILYVVATTDMAGYKDVLMGVFIAITQGILCAGGSVYVNQLVVQAKKKEE